MRVSTSLVLFSILGVASPAFSTTYLADIRGTVDSISLPSGATSDGKIKVGDAFLVSISIDTSTFASSITQIGNSVSAVYAVPLSYDLRLGGYARNGVFNNFSLGISDNRVISPSLTSDSISFSLVGGFVTSSPFSFATGSVFSTFSLGAFDQDLTKLTGVGFDQLTKFDQLSRAYAETSFYNSASNTNVYIRIRDLNGKIASMSVPEPATWAMMIAGFGLAGVAMRRRSTSALA